MARDIKQLCQLSWREAISSVGRSTASNSGRTQHVTILTSVARYTRLVFYCTIKCAATQANHWHNVFEIDKYMYYSPRCVSHFCFCNNEYEVWHKVCRILISNVKNPEWCVYVCRESCSSSSRARAPSTARCCRSGCWHGASPICFSRASQRRCEPEYAQQCKHASRLQLRPRLSLQGIWDFSVPTRKMPTHMSVHCKLVWMFDVIHLVVLLCFRSVKRTIEVLCACRAVGPGWVGSVVF